MFRQFSNQYHSPRVSNPIMRPNKLYRRSVVSNSEPKDEWPETKDIICYFDITEEVVGNPLPLFCGGFDEDTDTYYCFNDVYEKLYIDGIEIPNPSELEDEYYGGSYIKYTFDTIGRHEVKVTLKDGVTTLLTYSFNINTVEDFTGYVCNMSEIVLPSVVDTYEYNSLNMNDGNFYEKITVYAKEVPIVRINEQFMVPVSVLFFELIIAYLQESGALDGIGEDWDAVIAIISNRISVPDISVCKYRYSFLNYIAESMGMTFEEFLERKDEDEIEDYFYMSLMFDGIREHVRECDYDEESGSTVDYTKYIVPSDVTDLYFEQVPNGYIERAEEIIFEGNCILHGTNNYKGFNLFKKLKTIHLYGNLSCVNGIGPMDKYTVVYHDGVTELLPEGLVTSSNSTIIFDRNTPVGGYRYRTSNNQTPSQSNPVVYTSFGYPYSPKFIYVPDRYFNDFLSAYPYEEFKLTPMSKLDKTYHVTGDKTSFNMSELPNDVEILIFDLVYDGVQGGLSINQSEGSISKLYSHPTITKVVTYRDLNTGWGGSWKNPNNNVDTIVINSSNVSGLQLDKHNGYKKDIILTNTTLHDYVNDFDGYEMTEDNLGYGQNESSTVYVFDTQYSSVMTKTKRGADTLKKFSDKYRLW